MVERLHRYSFLVYLAGAAVITLTLYLTGNWDVEVLGVPLRAILVGVWFVGTLALALVGDRGRNNTDETEPERYGYRCARCEYRPTVEEANAGLTKCPRCETTAVPLADRHDVEVKINWQELRVLGIFAEQWAAQLKANHPDAPETDDPQRGVAIFCGRLQAQHPELPPLTLSGEIADIRRKFPDSTVVTNFPEDQQANDQEGDRG